MSLNLVGVLAYRVVWFVQSCFLRCFVLCYYFCSTPYNASMSYVRRCSHAGTDLNPGWYPGDVTALTKLLGALNGKSEIMKCFQERWQRASKVESRRLVGVLGPHAGIKFSGSTNCVAYQQLTSYLKSPLGNQVQRIIMMGPSHRKYFEGLELSGAASYQTPLHDFPVDADFLEKIRRRCADVKVNCSWMTQKTDEDEHSLEMHLPVLASSVLDAYTSSPKAANGTTRHNISLVPLLFGDVSAHDASKLAHVFAPLMASPENVFVVSTDFCHWGSRFRYTNHYHSDRYPNIEDAVVAMDFEGMRSIESGDPASWEEYLAQTRNTICGRNPISVLLKSIDALRETKPQQTSCAASPSSMDICFVHYSKSNTLQSLDDSSVSYASAVILQ